MAKEIAKINPRQVTRAGFETLPVAIIGAGERASWRFIEFFTANIRNKNIEERESIYAALNRER